MEGTKLNLGFYKAMEQSYHDTVFGFDEPKFIWATPTAIILLRYGIGELTPEVCAPCGPGFSVR